MSKKLKRWIKRNRIATMVAAVVALILVISLVIVPIIKNKAGKATAKQIETSKEIITKYYNAMEEIDGETVTMLLYPEVVRENMFEYSGLSLQESIDWETDEIQMMWDECSYVEATFSWEMKEVEKMGSLDTLKEQVKTDEIVDLEGFRAYVDKVFDQQGVDTSKITEVYAVRVLLSLDIYGDIQTEDVIHYVYQYDGEWYIGFKNIGSLSAMVYSVY